MSDPIQVGPGTPCMFCGAEYGEHFVDCKVRPSSRIKPAASDRLDEIESTVQAVGDCFYADAMWLITELRAARQQCQKWMTAAKGQYESQVVHAKRAEAAEAEVEKQREIARLNLLSFDNAMRSVARLQAELESKDTQISWLKPALADAQRRVGKLQVERDELGEVCGRLIRHGSALDVYSQEWHMACDDAEQIVAKWRERSQVKSS